MIHAVGPHCEIDRDPDKLLEATYRSVLSLTRQHSCVSIAFPAIACGVYRYGHQDTAEVALPVCMEPDWKDMEIMFYIFSAEAFTIWQQTLERLRGD